MQTRADVAHVTQVGATVLSAQMQVRAEQEPETAPSSHERARDGVLYP